MPQMPQKRALQKCCKSKGGIREVRQEDSNDLTSDIGDEFLGTVNADTVSIRKPWIAVVRLNERDLDFKIDTGADVTVISKSAHQPEKDGELEPALIPLNGPTGENLEVHSRFKASLSRKGEESWQTIYVVQNLSRPLLGQPEIQALKVAVLIEPVQGDSVVEEFPELFKGLGKQKDSYKIKLQDEVTPFTLSTP